MLDVVFRGVKVDLETNQTGYVLRLHLVAKFNFDVGRCGDQNNFSLDLGVCVWVMISFNIACRLLIIDLTCICYYARPQQRWRSIVMSTSVCVCVCVSVCVSVCLSASIYLPKHSRDFYQIFRACCLSPWLGRPPSRWLSPKGNMQFCGFSFPLNMHCMGRIQVWISLQFRLNLLLYRKFGQFNFQTP